MRHNITINKTALFYTLGNLKNPKTIWFVLHGYGYLAKYFVKKFNPILNKDTLIVAPEGLSKFYLNGVGVDGRVGASWMTKENREEEITDYVHYLNQLYATIVKNNATAKINIVGFSQGGATASRWLANGLVKCDNFILWASFFPEDMELKSFDRNTKTYILYGDNDEYVTPERIKKIQKFLSLSDFNYQLIKFKGKHDILEKVLVEQCEKFNWR